MFLSEIRELRPPAGSRFCMDISVLKQIYRTELQFLADATHFYQRSNVWYKANLIRHHSCIYIYKYAHIAGNMHRVYDQIHF